MSEKTDSDFDKEYCDLMNHKDVVNMLKIAVG